jgi:hypothetical protein
METGIGLHAVIIKPAEVGVARGTALFFYCFNMKQVADRFRRDRLPPPAIAPLLHLQ